jgi:hypothetical protein
LLKWKSLHADYLNNGILAPGRDRASSLGPFPSLSLQRPVRVSNPD